MIKCYSCGLTKPAEKYYPSNKTSCKACTNIVSYAWNKRSRKNSANRYKWVYTDTKASDLKRGLTFDLTKEQVKTLIETSCTYCGSVELKMTLDRINNSLGHTISNVISSCIRCNYLRRDMPYEAWIELVPHIKAVYERGLFGNWTGGPHKTKNPTE